ncbi:extracellular solute-binding protein [Marinicrinis lubricantis]|uniref:Extracellular solute-binding protein n=1 Tax=Marinicrinis lubricantis TaxID=2086470 RepID=A0ABW1IVU6_9BACL
MKTKLLLIALLFVQSLSACEQNGITNHEGQTKTDPSFLYQEPGLSPYDPPIEITFVREMSDNLEQLLNGLPDETLEDNRWSRLYKQVLGIEITYNWVDQGEQYYKKLGAALASGNIPDVVEVNAQQLRQLANAGWIEDLTSVYETYASSFTKQVLTQEGPGALETATIDGRLMGIPQNDSSIERAMYIWIRTDWLDQLGLLPPKSMEDVLTISKAFTENDPDRNGKHDTYGLALTYYLWDPVLSATGFMAGYDAFPRIWVEDESGKLEYGGIQPEVKTALAVLQKMYAQGQIDNEFAFKDGVKVKKQIAAGKIGMMYGEQWGSFVVQESREHDPNAQWQAFPIVSAAGEIAKVPLRISTDRYWAVRKGYEHPEAIVKLFNLYLEKNWGDTAQYETYYNTLLPVWQLSPVNPFPPMKNLEAFRQLEEARKTGNSDVLEDEAKFIQEKLELYVSENEDRESGWGWERTYGPEGAMAILDQYERNDQLLFDQFAGAPTATMIDKEMILDNLQLDTYINIILGSPIDEFDQFVDEWKRIGGDQITSEVNEWYAHQGGPS